MVEQPRAEFDVDAVGGVREQIGAQDAHDGLEHRDRNQSDHEHVERAERAMHQHLVDDDLEEQRRDQPEQLQEERRQQDLAEQAPVFVDRAEEPADVEAAADVRQSGAARHQDQSAVPDRQQFVARHQHGTGIVWRLHQHFSLAGLGNHHETAVAQACNRRQRHFGKPRPFGAAGPRLQSEVFGAPENLRCADLVGAQPVADLLAIRRHTLEMQ